MFCYEEETKKLKEYMRNEGIMNVILYEELIHKNIMSINDIKSLNENNFNEIKRKVRVRTNKNIKDNNKKMRVDICLNKFEKIWRKNTGKQRRQSSVTLRLKSPKNNHNKKFEKTRSATQIEIQSGFTLKQYLRKHDLYSTDLYDALTGKGIESPDDFKLIKQKDVNKIIRDIKVQRGRVSNNMKTLNQQLKKFEKLWKIKSKSRRHASAFVISLNKSKFNKSSNIFADKSKSDIVTRKYS
mmetsp:Transcript_49309/g.60569  ORF Transcript_49309/g.60569 Transcript_49309/m.60569 type:complete len:241 (-) Transcript_49309:52-774(-)